MDNLITNYADKLVGCHNAMTDVEQLLAQITNAYIPSGVVSPVIRGANSYQKLESLHQATNVLLERIKGIRTVLEDQQPF